jgi:hypothetical protein
MPKVGEATPFETEPPRRRETNEKHTNSTQGSKQLTCRSLQRHRSVFLHIPAALLAH